MQVSPVDIQAWASETGAEYPSTPAEKAAVLPAVMAWKQEQLQDAAAARGQNALNVPLMAAAGAGLGIAGLAAYQHFRARGLSHEQAQAGAAQTQSDAVRATTPAPEDAPPTPSELYTGSLGRDQQDFSSSDTRIVRAKGKRPIGGQEAMVPRTNRRGQIIDNAALAGATRQGTAQGRQRGEYNLKSPWNDPVLGPRMAAADTEERQRQLIGRLMQENPAVVDDVIDALAARSDRALPIERVKSANDLPVRALAVDGNVFWLEDTRETVVTRGGKFVSASPAGVRQRMAPTGAEAYGSDTRQENEKLVQTRRQSGQMFQPGWYPDKVLIDDNGQELGDDDNGAYRLDNAHTRALAEGKLLEQRTAQAAALEKAGDLGAAARLRALGGRITETNTVTAAPEADYHPKWETDSDGFRKVVDGQFVPVTRQRNGRTVSVFERDPGSDNIRLDQVLSDKEDALTKGMMEPLPASRSNRRNEDYGFRAAPFFLVDTKTGAVIEPEQKFTGEVRTVVDGSGNKISVPVAMPSEYPNTWVETPQQRFVPNGQTRTTWDPNTETYKQVPLGNYEVVLDSNGEVVWSRRPATPQDLVVMSQNEGPSGSPYYGKPAAQVASAMEASSYDYSRPADPGSYDALLADGSTGRIERAPFQQSAYILKEPQHALSRALAASHHLTTDTEGKSRADIYGLYGVDQPMVDRAHAFQRGDLEFPARRAGNALAARAVGGHTSKDWATQVLSSMAVTPRPDAWRLDALEKGTTREQSAELARGWLNSNPGIAETLSSNLQGVPLVEQINIVQEALSDAAVDFPKAVQWAAQQQPELAERARLGGSGSFGFEQFQKSYVRKAVLGAVAQLKNAGGDAAPEVMLPAAVSELLANEARVHNPENPNIAGAINRRIGGTTDPIEALWKLDGILSDAASDKLNEGYTNGSLLAEGFFKAASPGDGSRVGAMKERFGGRTNDAYFSSPQIGPTPHEPMASRMPIRIGFSSNVPGAGAALNRNDIATPAEVLHQAINGSGIQLRQDDAEINPAVVGRGASARPSALRTRVSGRNPRAFAVNSILDNEYKALMGKSAEIAAAAKSGQITIEDAKAQRAKIAAQLGGIARRQTLLDATREGNELLLQDANRQARGLVTNTAGSNSANPATRGSMLELVTASGDRRALPAVEQERPVATQQSIGEGRGYILDLGANGVVRALPDIGSNVLSYEQVFEKPERENEEAFDRATLEDSHREEGRTGEALRVDAEPAARVDVSRPFSDAEAAPMLQQLRQIREINADLRNLEGSQPQSDWTPPAPLSHGGRDDEFAMSPRFAGPGEAPESQRAAARALATAWTAPASAAPRAYREMANTLEASRQRALTEQEVNDARARHIGDYISSAATPTFDRAGRQTRGWTGGDSWHGGARLAGRADRNVGAYVPPSDAMVATLAKLARRRAGVA